MQPYIITLADGSISSEIKEHNGEMFMHVLQGNVVLKLGIRQVMLAEGDSVYMDGSLERSFKSNNGMEVTVIVVKADEKRKKRL